MKGFGVPEQPTMVRLKEDSTRPGNSVWMYTTDTLKPDGHEVSLKPNRDLWLIGFASASVYIVAYEGSVADTNATSTAMYVHSADIASTRVVVPVADTTPYSKQQLDAARLGGRKEGAGLVKDAAVAKATEVGA